ncbi:type II toxin-antitoxin system VapC family toxin [candidate division KSB1 bacterium]|nr:type II toxin-antitoxin system VapC family toxin [candidate division KSB1 bacterium]
MRFLLDTHTVLYIAQDNPRLGTETKKIYMNENNELLLSIVSVWEMAIKTSLKKLSLPGTLSEFVKKHVRAKKIDILPVMLSHIFLLENLTFFHPDPFDRMIAAQAIVENIPILSKDNIFDEYSVRRIW